MALTDKLTAIADGFRSSRGISDKLTMEQMATLAAEPLGTVALMLPAGYADYIREEAAAVAQRVRAVLTDESIVFLAMSDSHYPGDEDGAWNQDQNNEGSLHTAMAAKALTYMLPFDFVAHTGDVGNGEASTTPDEMQAQIQKFVDYFVEAGSDIPMFIAIGNHDPGIYYHNAQTDGEVHTLAGDWLYENFTAYSDSEDTVFGGVENGGYCYRDFTGKKLRVFLLNSAEQLVTAQYDAGTLPSQQLWVANALKELGSKEDAAEWKFIVLCHYPLDYGDARPISNVFKAYVNGESISITVDGTANTVDFSGSNGAKFLAQFHGHTHCFKYARLNGYDSSGTMTEYDAWRVAIPNVQYNRENYYTSSYYGIYFCEDESYPKTPGTAEDTSFVINVINPSEEMIYSFCYGAGYDRAISIVGVSYYSVHTDLTGATVASSATTIKEGEPYTGTITVTDGYTLDSVVVTMGGVDITDTVYADGVITIPEVTGTINITVVAKAPPVNMLTVAIDTDGSLYNGGTGYKSGYRISSSGGGESALAGSYISGFIPADIENDTLILYNIGTESVSYKDALVIGFTALDSTKVHGYVKLSDLTANSDGSLTIIKSNWSLSENWNLVKYVRLSCSYIGSDSEIYIE